MALAAGALAGALTSWWLQKPTSSPPKEVIYLPMRSARLEAPGDQGFIQAVQKAMPSVVFIRGISERVAGDDFWSYWGLWLPRSQRVYSAGSGVVWRADGYIVTNFHVVREATQILVSLPDKRTFEAQLVGGDAGVDIALLKVDAKNLKPLPLANSDSVQIGQWVLAIGNPYNLTYTVTAGIVSARGRNLNLLQGSLPIESFIQTDAAINPGNSGGALVDLEGRLVGINTAIASRTGSYVGYGFAIPSNIVRKAVEDLLQYGLVQRAFLDAEVQDVPPNAETASAENLAGVYVSAVEPDGAAAKAGLQRGDYILAVDGRAVQTQAELLEYLAQKRPGDRVRFQLRRGGKLLEAWATLTSEDGEPTLLKRKAYHSDFLGADLMPISRREAQALGVRYGIRITNLRNGILADMGLSEGFILTSINGYVPRSAEEVEEILRSTRGRLTIEGVTPQGTRVFQSYYRR